MARIRVKRVYEPVDAADGFRVLVDRMWPRGMRRDEVHFDLWAKFIAPSPELRQWYHADPQGRWAEFRRKYTHELRGSDDVSAFLETIRNKPVVTLLFASKNPVENHALILREYLEKTLAGAQEPDPVALH